MLHILRMGETTHDSSFRVLREKGYPFYLLLLIKTPSCIEVNGTWKQLPSNTALLFHPGQRHSYRAAGGNYTDCWMHLESTSPLLFEGFPFGKPLPLQAEERFYALFRVLSGEFFAESRTKNSVLDSLTNALLSMLSAEVEVRGPLFYPFLALREEIFHTPAAPRSADNEAKRLGVSRGYFHTLYKQYFHTTFIADVVASRLQAAEELLTSTDESIERIAERCGYLNVEHFIRQFKHATGSTPHRYRTQAKNE